MRLPMLMIAPGNIGVAFVAAVLGSTPVLAQEPGAPLAGQEWSVGLEYGFSDGGSWTFAFQSNGCIEIEWSNGTPDGQSSCASQFAVTGIDHGFDGSSTADIVFSYQDFIYAAGSQGYVPLQGTASGETRCTAFSVPDIGEQLADPDCAMPPLQDADGMARWTVTRTR
jgi:hypothetical protein